MKVLIALMPNCDKQLKILGNVWHGFVLQTASDLKLTFPLIMLAVAAIKMKIKWYSFNFRSIYSIKGQPIGFEDIKGGGDQTQLTTHYKSG